MLGGGDNLTVSVPTPTGASTTATSEGILLVVNRRRSPCPVGDRVEGNRAALE